MLKDYVDAIFYRFEQAIFRAETNYIINLKHRKVLDPYVKRRAFAIIELDKAHIKAQQELHKELYTE